MNFVKLFKLEPADQVDELKCGDGALFSRTNPDFLQQLFKYETGEMMLPDLINTWLSSREEIRDILVMTECTVKVYNSIENEELFVQGLLSAGS